MHPIVPQFGRSDTNELSCTIRLFGCHQAMSYPILAVFSAIVLGGSLGGVGSAFLQDFLRRTAGGDERPQVRLDWPLLIKSLVLGIVASTVVPLFLEIAAVGSDKGILSTILAIGGHDDDKWAKYFLLFGFCTIAAVSAQQFLKTIEERVLKDVSEAKSKAEAAINEAGAARRETSEVRVRAQRAQEAADDAEGMAAALEEPAIVKEGIGQDADCLLKAFMGVKSEEPSIDEMRQKLRISREEIEKTADALKNAGLMRETGEGNGPTRWSLRGWGKRRALELVGGLNETDEKVLRALNTLSVEKRIRRPTIRDIAEHLKLATGDVDEALVRLLKFGSVAKSGTEPGGWRVRGWGQQHLLQKEKESRAAKLPS